MKLLTLFFFLLCSTVNLRAQQIINTISELEDLLTKEDYKSAYKLTNQRITTLLKNGSPDTLAYYIEYLGTTSDALNGFQTAKKEVLATLEKTKSQFPYSKDLPVIYLDAADFFSKKGEDDLAYDLVIELLQYFKGKEDIISKRLSTMHNSLGTFAMRIGNKNLSSKHFREAIRQFRSDDVIELYTVYNTMGIVMWNASKVDSTLYYMKEAEKTLTKAKQTPANKYLRRAMIQGNLSNVYWELGKVDLSIQKAEQAIANYKHYSKYAENENEKEKGTKGYYMVILNLGNCYQELGNYSHAQELMEYSYNGRLRAFGDNNPEAYKSLAMLATVYFDQRNYDKAEKSLNKSIAFWEKKEPSVWLAQSVACLAYLNEERQRVNEASIKYERADKLYQVINGEEYSLEYLRFLSKASYFYANNKQTEKAITTSERSVKYALKNQGEASLITIYQMVDMANIYLTLKNYDKALMYSNRSLAAITKMVATGESMLDSISIEIKKPKAILARTKAKYYMLSKKDSTSIEQLLHELNDAARLLEQRKHIFSQQDDINSLIADNKELTDFIKKLNYELFKLSDNKEYINNILNVHESALYTRVRSRMEHQNAIRFSKVPKHVQEQETALKQKLQNILKGEATADDKVMDYLQAVKDWDNFQKKLQREYPEYYKMRYASTDVSLKELSTIIPKNLTLIRYIFSEDELLVLIASKEKQLLVPLGNKNLKEKITALHDITDAKKICALSHDLYNSLWQPIQQHIKTKRVTVIPDEVLYNVSFEMLSPVATQSFTELSQECLLNKYAFSYHYSVLAMNMQRKPTEIKDNFIAFTPGFSDEDKRQYLAVAKKDSLKLDNTYMSLLPLPFTSNLAEKIRSKFGGILFSKNTSTSKAFRDQAGNHHIIHIGTHAESNNDYPEYSRLIFAKNHEKPNAENSVYLYDIYDCNLTADLAVLTACESGKPGYQDGEGMISMAHAFNYAGSESIMTGLWKLDEQSSAIITEAFYENLEDGMTKDEALQKAKLSYLASAKGRTVAPQYWAGLVIMGDLSPVKLESSSSKYIYWLAGGLVIIGGFFLARRRIAKR